MKRIFLTCLLSVGALSVGFSQIGQVVNDTIYLVSDPNKPVEFSKAIGKYVYIKNIVPADIPVKSRKISIISSKSTEIDTKSIEVVDDKHLIIPLSLFTEKYYTLYIWKGNATLLAKKLIIK